MGKSLKHRLWIISGASGVGKSTWIANHKKFFDDSVEIISRDAIRFNLLKDEDDYFGKENEVWAEFVKQAKFSLEKNIDTILDATHLNEKSRAKILRALGTSLKNISVNVIAFEADINWCINNNNKREGRAYVPETAIKNLYASFTEPEYEEGFDNIYIVRMPDTSMIKKEKSYG